MTLIIVAAVSLVVGAMGGLFIGRRNPKIATTAQDLADAAKKAAGL